ncbi:MAG: acyl-CoA dehydrogenase family protein [Acidobacteriota bacterium]
MDFEDTPEQAEFRREARAWLSQQAPAFELDPNRALKIESTADLDHARSWQRTKAEAGWAGLNWPEEYGGRALSPLHAIIWQQEEQAYAVPRGALFSISLNFCGSTMMAYASEEQKRHHLPRILSGEEIWCQLFSEPGAGSDLAGLRTRSERQGDEWVVNGQKVWNTLAQYADFGILVTRHDPTLPKHKGMTYFFVDMRSEGLEARPIVQISGSSSFNEVFFTNVRIPDANRLGEVGAGWQVALTTLMNERLGAGSLESPPDYQHVMELASVLDEAPLGDAAVRDRVADWYVESQGLRLVKWRILTALARGDQPGPEASIQKLVAANKQQAISSFGLDLQEQGGILENGDAPLDGLLQKTFLGSPAARIAGGTDEILRNIIAERVLRLPGDIRVDRDVPFEKIPSGS